MVLLPFPMSANLEGDLSSGNPIIKLLRSRTAAVFLTFVSLLYPFEAFSANCQIQSPLVCLDSTPCKVISGVNVCLAGVNPLPDFALQSTETCWQAKASYTCVDAAVVNDTCAPLRNDPKCGVIGSKCIMKNPTTNVCEAYTDTYQCQTGGGLASTAIDCSGQTYCDNGTCFTKKDDPNSSLGNVVAGMELARQSGFYLDPATLTVFKGVPSWCTDNTLGLAKCCKPNAEGMTATDAVIVDQLIKSGWNVWVKDVIGSEYTFNTLYDTASGFIDRAVSGMSEVVNKTVSAGTNTAVTGPNTTSTPTTTGVSGAAVGGMIGGVIGSYAGSTFASNHGANTAWTGVAGAAGYAGGFAGGAYAGAYATSYASTLYSTSSFTAAASQASAAGSSAITAVCWGCVLMTVVIMIIMALLACDPEEVKTQLQLGAGLCHEVGSWCSAKLLGSCMTVRHQQCCFNSKLAKIVNEQGRPQIAKSWGGPKTPDCTGFTAAELQSLDFSLMDLSEFIADVTAKVMPDGDAIADNVTARLDEFYSTTPESTMNGVIPGPTAGIPVPLTVTTVDPPTAPPLPACNWTLAKNPPAANGNITGTFTVTSCLRNGMADWAYTGNCPALQGGIPTDTMINSAGKTTRTLTIPASCLAATAPAAGFENTWGVRIFDTPSGMVSGTIHTIW